MALRVTCVLYAPRSMSKQCCRGCEWGECGAWWWPRSNAGRPSPKARPAPRPRAPSDSRDDEPGQKGFKVLQTYKCTMLLLLVPGESRDGALFYL